MKNGSIVLSLAASLVFAGLTYSSLEAKEPYGPQRDLSTSLSDPTKDFSKEMSDSKDAKDSKNAKDTKDLKESNAKESKSKEPKRISDAKNVEQVDGDEAVGAQKKGFQLGDLNPIRWIFKPVTDMQEKVVHLEKQIVRLEGPISGLQKPMVDVRGNMVQVEGQLQGVSGNMSSVDKRLGHVEKQLDKMYQPIVELKKTVQDLAGPIKGLREQLNMILTAVLVVGVMICVGTPVVALFAFRYRVQIMKMLGGEHNAQRMAEDTGDSRREYKKDAVASS